MKNLLSRFIFWFKKMNRKLQESDLRHAEARCLLIYNHLGWKRNYGGCENLLLKEKTIKGESIYAILVPSYIVVNGKDSHLHVGARIEDVIACKAFVMGREKGESYD